MAGRERSRNRKQGNALGKWRKKHKEQQQERGGDWPIKTPEGAEFLKITAKEDRCFKLVPYKVIDPKHPDADVGDTAFRRPYQQHKNIGPNEQAVICLGTWGKSDAICKERERFRAAGDKKAAGALNSSRRGLYLVVDVDVDEKEKKVYMLDQPDSMGKAPGFGRMLEEEILRLDATSPAPWEEDGMILEVRFGEDTFNGNKFYPATRIDLVEPSKRQQRVIEAIDHENAPCLDGALNRLSPEKIEATLFGADDDDDDDEQEKPTSHDEEPTQTLTYEDLADMDHAELIEVAEAENVSISGRLVNADNSAATTKVRHRIIEALGLKPEEETEDEEKKTDAWPNPEEFKPEDLDDLEPDDLADLAEAWGVTLDRKTLRDLKKNKKGATDKAKEILTNEIEDVADKETKTKKPAPSREKKGENECPSGHEFGVDCDEHKDCQKCDSDVWEKCADYKDELEDKE